MCFTLPPLKKFLFASGTGLQFLSTANPFRIGRQLSGRLSVTKKKINRYLKKREMKKEGGAFLCPLCLAFISLTEPAQREETLLPAA